MYYLFCNKFAMREIEIEERTSSKYLYIKRVMGGQGEKSPSMC